MMNDDEGNNRVTFRVNFDHWRELRHGTFTQ